MNSAHMADSADAAEPHGSHDLVLQGPDASVEHARALQRLTRARLIEQHSEHVYRLCGVDEENDGSDGHDVRGGSAVAAYCAPLAIDFARVPSGRRLADFKLLALDMDSTLITVECIDELADLKGVKPEVAAITAAAMRGEIDFKESLHRRVQLLAGLSAGALEAVYNERLRLSQGAQALIDGVRSLGITTLLVSGGFDFFTERLKQRLRLDYARSNSLEIVDAKLSGRLLGDVLDAAAKAEALRALQDRLGLEAAQTIVIGDGANDLPMMAEAAVSIAYRAKPVVREQATYSFNHNGLDGLLNLFR